MRHLAGRNDTITGLRGLLASSVVLYHVYTGAVDDGILKADYIPRIGEMVGPLAVCLFFVISGYLIPQSLVRHGSIRKFAIDRALRIYPVFLIIHLLIFAIGPVIGYKWFQGITAPEYILHFVSNLLFLPGVFDLPIAQIVAWSLSYEAAFYLIMGAGYYILKGKGWRYALLPIPLAASAWLIWKDPAFLFFVAGILLGIGKLPARLPQFTRLDGLAALVFACLLYDPDFIYGSLICAFVFFHTVARQYGYLSAFLRTRPFIWLGNISYSLYLWHTFVMFPVKRIVIALDLPNEWIGLAAFGIVSVAGSLLVSHFSYHWIEVKFTRLVRQRIRSSAGAQTAHAHAVRR